MTFAGFWVDGAVRKPDEQHFDRNGWVIANWKDKQPDLDICRRHFDQWAEVYWLDTTPRESLTPEELFSVVKVLWPDSAGIKKARFTGWIGNTCGSETPIDWGNLTQYPPLVEPQWIRVTRENVGQYLFRECRFWIIPRGDKKTWNGVIVGWCPTDNVCLVESDYHESESILKWDVVEVQA